MDVARDSQVRTHKKAPGFGGFLRSANPVQASNPVQARKLGQASKIGQASKVSVLAKNIA